MKNSEKENKKNIESVKNKAKKLIDEAEKGYIVINEKGAAIVGDKCTCLVMLTTFFECRIREGDFTETELKLMTTLANPKTSEALGKIINLLKGE